MSFQYTVGRFYPQSKEIYIKAVFAEMDEAKKYAAGRDLDICPNSILFIDDKKEKKAVFLSYWINVGNRSTNLLIITVKTIMTNVWKM